jgi:DNA-binding NarL/FixJ family response regulator
MPPSGGWGFLGRADERRRIDDVLALARDGESAVLVVRGEPGIGKTALLRYAARQASGLRVAQVEGVQAEMELPFSGIHRLCAPMLDSLDELPEPQANALRVALGLSSGDTPDKFLVAVAVLTLLATAAQERPLLCLVDDAQWLDATSSAALGFVARRLMADGVALIFALREPATTRALEGLPQLVVEGLDDSDARALLALAVPSGLHERVRDRIIGETRGNPLALVELSRRMSPTERAGGFSPAAGGDLPDQLTLEYQQRLAELREPTRQLLLLAAAEPLGEAALLWRAADRISIEPSALTPATEAGLLVVDDRVRFHHPLVRSAVYRAASTEDRRRAHRALAEASDPELASDTRAWHRALATAEPDEAVASELEHSASRAQGRGDLAAAAAFLDRATTLTPDPTRQAGRALAAAEVSFRAGDFQATQRLLATARSGVLDDAQLARAALLRGHAAVVLRYGNEAAAMLLEAARQLERVDPSLARRAYLTAWSAAVTADHLGGTEIHAEVSRAIRALPPSPGETSPLDLVIDGLALLVTDGHEAAMPTLQLAAEEVLQLPVEDVLKWGWHVGGVRSAIWDDQAIAVYERQAQVVREAGALAELPIHLQALALERAWRGDLPGARLLVSEAENIAASTGNRVPPFAMLRILALEGREDEASTLIGAVLQEGTRQGQGIAVMVAHWAAAVLNNGLGRYDEAAAAAREVVANTVLPWLAMWVRCELVEAAAKVGDIELAVEAVEGVVVTTRPASSHLARGVEARCRALVAASDAEGLHREAIAHLDASGNAVERARARLAYGEWLLGQGRPRDARERLRAAEELFAGIGMEAFADRARGQLVAAGAKPRTRSATASDDLTPQEAQIARLARNGLTNAQIGAQLFLSSRTVEWHLHKAFGKLRIDSRDALEGVLKREEKESLED